MKMVSKGILVIIVAIACFVFAAGINILAGAGLVWLASKVIIGVEFSWGIAIFVGAILTVIGGLLK